MIHSLIPLYRARVLKEVDEYIWIEGYLSVVDSISTKDIMYKITVFDKESPFNSRFIDIDTLSIYIPNNKMEDIDGKKLFAALNRDGYGGDIIKGHYNDEEEVILCFRGYSSEKHNKYNGIEDNIGLCVLDKNKKPDTIDEDGDTIKNERDNCSFTYYSAKNKKVIGINTSK